LDIAVPAEHFIVIAGNIYYPGALAEKVEDLFDHLQMRGRKIMLAELPSIYDITVQNKDLGRNAPEILNDLIGMTSISAQMEV
jgi:predicted nicotinamide N-methyase